MVIEKLEKLLTALFIQKHHCGWKDTEAIEKGIKGNYVIPEA